MRLFRYSIRPSYRCLRQVPHCDPTVRLCPFVSLPSSPASKGGEYQYTNSWRARFQEIRLLSHLTAGTRRPPITHLRATSVHILMSWNSKQIGSQYIQLDH
ncbi:hypothetical protein NDU88_001806 [Pleurodeles waltl]|uniref:Uncharacterized protein n=1 Tax=Pleurodeles waltl TaxID=8319 RepID=A0AAV7TL63_PLEWA|nr:hypothetical protein NDU88_001806 [Pleurodeles waltl]